MSKNIAKIKLSVKEIASNANVSISSWYKYEKGHQFPRKIKTMKRIAKSLNIKMCHLFE